MVPTFMAPTMSWKERFKSLIQSRSQKTVAPGEQNSSSTPPYAPHMGRAWERLVKSVKNTLKTILREQAPKEETLRTLLTEAEFIVNNRPLT